jgi:outer membrane protein assembly factor BamA
MLSRLIAIGLLSFLSHQAWADSSEVEKPRIGWKSSVFPIAFYLPETSLAAGIYGLIVYRRDAARQSRPDTMPATAFATLKGQYSAAFAPGAYLDDEGVWQARLKFGYSFFPNDFYGLGGETLDSAKEPFSTKTLSIKPSIHRKLFSNFVLGPMLAYRSTVIVETKPGGIIASGVLPGSSGSKMIGAGLMLEWDTRDHLLAPTEGSWHLLQVITYRPVLGATASGTQIVADLRRYISIGRGGVLAFQTAIASSSSSLPFDSYQPLGLRGISNGRLRGRSSLMMQVEYRFPIKGRLSGAGFGGVGDVYDGTEGFSFATLKPALGAGLRWCLDQQEKLNLRFDLGVSRYGMAPYILIQESF